MSSRLVAALLFTVVAGGCSCAPPQIAMDPAAACDAQGADNSDVQTSFTVKTVDDTLPDAEDLHFYLVPQGGGAPVRLTHVQRTSDTEAKLTIAADSSAPPGMYAVRLATDPAADAEFTETAPALEIFGRPAVTGVQPQAACNLVANTFTLTGQSFRPGDAVMVGGQAATEVTVASDTSLTARFDKLDVDSTAPVDLKVTHPETDDNGKACSQLVRSVVGVAPAPKILAIEPARGWVGIDNPVRIVGERFGSGTFALKGAGPNGTDLPLTVLGLTPTSAEAIVPAGGTASATPYELVYSQPSACGTSLAKAFTLDATPAITVTSVTPRFGWVKAPTSVTLTGTGFASTPRVYLLIPPSATESPNTARLRLLKSTAFVSATSITTVVPAGLPVGGPYPFVVINPDGSGGSSAPAFKIVANPPPTISTVSTTSFAKGVAASVTVTGCNFRTPSVSTVAPGAQPTAQGAATNVSCTRAAVCPGDGGKTPECTLTSSVTLASTGLYLLRVTNDDETSADFSALVARNPSANLETGFKQATSLETARRSLASAAGRIDQTRRYVYAIGGEDNAGAALDTVELSPVDVFGQLGAWRVQRYKLNTKRAGLAVVEHGGYLYALGGTSSTGGTLGNNPNGSPLDSIERAKILTFADAPVVFDTPTVTASATGLDKGSWLYKVSAIKGGVAVDADNPDGETLPSDEIVAALYEKSTVKLSITPVTGAVKYRIYRTAAANGASQSEVLLDELAAPTGTGPFEYTDDGSKTPNTSGTPDSLPLFAGSTGKWQTLPEKLTTPRFNFGATIAGSDSATPTTYLYAVGGHGPAGTLDTWEKAKISLDATTRRSTLEAFAANTTNKLVVARERLGIGVMSAANGPKGYSGTKSFVILTGGLGVSGSAPKVEYAVADANGDLAFKTASDQFSPNADAGALGVANGFAFVFGGVGSTAAKEWGESVNTSAIVTGMNAGTLFSGDSWNQSASIPTLGLGNERSAFGFAAESSFFYVVGGTTTGTDATKTVVQVLY